MKKRSVQLLAAGSLLAAGQAFAVNIGGLEIPLGVNFSAGQIYTNVPTVVGEELSGYGKIDSFNSDAVGDLCGGCELTYVFNGYTLSKIESGVFSFTGGSVKVYMGTGATKDFSIRDPGSSVADDIGEASNGDLWLSLTGHAINGYSLTSTGSIAGSLFTGNSEGFLDVDAAGGGTANAFFNSNTARDGSDFLIQSSFNSFSSPYPGTVAGSMNLNTAAVPEPETYALMLSALGLIGYVVHRRRRV